ncbi:hypothetical protein HMPREF0004_0845, partial [Achromobacter piechaudii ATCC 43553]
AVATVARSRPRVVRKALRVRRATADQAVRARRCWASKDQRVISPAP